MSKDAMDRLINRINKLGIRCDNAPVLDDIDPAIAVVASFPMHMVAVASTVLDSTSDDGANTKHLFNITGVREAFVIGNQAISLQVRRADIKVLNEMLALQRSADIIIYEYALDTLNLYFSLAEPSVVEHVKDIVARSIVAVAEAAGEGWFGAGNEPSNDQRACIRTICSWLKLHQSKTASSALRRIDA